MNFHANSIMISPKNTETLSIILKLVGEACNLNCAYCYEKRKPYSGQRILDPNYVSMLLDKVYPHRVAIELHGGEPLLYPKKEFKELFNILRNHESVSVVRIQTNGTLLNQESLKYLLDECPDLEIGISLDGDLESNAYRFDYKKLNSYNKIETSLRLLTDSKVDVGVIMVVNSLNIRNVKKNLDEFAKYNCIKTVKFVPCFDINLDNTSKTESWAITPAEYADFLIDTFKYWHEKALFRKFIIEPHLSVIKKLSGSPTINCHYSENKCSYVYTLYPNGSIGSCDEFERIDSAIIRVQDLEPGALIANFERSKLVGKLDGLLEKCDSCSYFAVCSGGCLATRKRLQNTKQYEGYCLYRIKFIDFISNELNHVGQQT